MPNSLLWLYGKPGCGKSIICSTVIERLVRICDAHPMHALAYFYFDFSDTAKQNVRNMLTSIIVQLCRQRPDIPNALQSLYEKYGDGRFVFSVAELQTTLSATMEGFEQIYLVLDAVDECPRGGLSNDRGKVLNTIRHIHQARDEHLHVLLTSRKYPDIEQALPAESLMLLNVEDFVKNDLEVFLHRQLKSERFQHWAPDITSEVNRSLAERADGMFRWVSCQLDELEHLRLKRQIKSSLNLLPASLDETYERMLLSVEPRNSNQAVTALNWVLFSKRPLLLAELAEVLSMDLTTDPVLDLDDLDDRIQGDDVLKLLPGLIELSSTNDRQSFVTFAHPSIKDYLVSRYELRKITVGRTPIQVSEKDAHDSIAELCLPYLLQVLNVPKEWDDLVIAYPLLPYATMYTFSHIQSSGLCKDSIMRLMQEFTDTSMRPWAVWTSQVRINRYGDLLLDHSNPDNASPLYIMAFLNIREPLRALIVRGHDVNLQAGLFDTPLQVACYFGLRELVGILLDEGADPNLRGGEFGSPLHSAAASGGVAIIEMLLARGGDISLRDVNGDSILVSAASAGMIEAVKFLLVKGDKIFRMHHKERAFREAAAYGHTDILRIFLNQRIDINCANASNTTALHGAAANGEEDCVVFLLDKGANPNVCDKLDGDALRAALSNDNCKESVISCLLAHGVSLSDADDCGLEQVMPLAICAAQCKNKEAVKLLLEAGMNPKRTEEDKSTALHHAAASGDDAVLICFLEHELNINAQDEDGNTALHIAAKKANRKSVDALLTKNPDVNILNRIGLNPAQIAVNAALKDKSWDAAGVAVCLLDAGSIISNDQYPDTNPAILLYAAHGGYLTALRRLVACIRNMDVTLDGQERALFWASFQGFELGVELLLEHGANASQVRCDERSPLLVAAERGHSRILLQLLDKGADIGTKNSRGNTALHYSCLNGHWEAAKILLDRGASVDTGNENGWTALCQAAWIGSLDIIRLLLERGPTINNGGGNIPPPSTEKSANIEARTQTGHTPLLIAARNGQEAAAIYLLELGADISARDIFGNDALLCTAATGKRASLKLIRKLLDKGCDIESKNEHLSTALHFFSESGNEEASAFMLEMGADINAKDADGDDALHCAAISGSKSIAKLLLDRGADLSRKNFKGQTPADLAEERRQNDTACWLRELQRTRAI